MWAARTGNQVRLVSANDHVHSRGSAHYAGLALDLHASAPDELAEAFRILGYRVLWKVPGHYAHMHVEDPAVSSVSPRPRRPANAALRQASTRRAASRRTGG